MFLVPVSASASRRGPERFIALSKRKRAAGIEGEALQQAIAELLIARPSDR